MSRVKYPLILVCVGYLLGCSNSPVQTNYPRPATPQPRPPIQTYSDPISDPITPVFYNGFLGLSCDELVPPNCTDAPEPFLTFDRPGKEGRDCIIPGICYSVIGRELHIDADDPGFPLIRRDPIKVPFTISAIISAVCKDPAEICWTGIAGYAGEMAYRGLYLDRDGVYTYTPIVTKRLADFVPGVPYALRIDYDGAHVWRYYINGALAFTETQGSITEFPTNLSHLPIRPSVWAGNVSAVVTHWAVR